ncbi:hypothetical protein AVEN_229170-1, partial [Araneus ventricosus]
VTLCQDSTVHHLPVTDGTPSLLPFHGLSNFSETKGVETAVRNETRKHRTLQRPSLEIHCRLGTLRLADIPEGVR